MISRPQDTRRIFLYLTSEAMEINGASIEEKDQARIDLEDKIVFKANEKSDFILIDVPSCKGWGYDEKTLRGARP